MINTKSFEVEYKYRRDTEHSYLSYSSDHIYNHYNNVSQTTEITTKVKALNNVYTYNNKQE